MKYSLSPREIPRAPPSGFPSGSGYISPYIPPLVTIQTQYIVLNIGMLNLNASVLPLSKGYISQYTPYGICGLIFNEVNELIISLMIIRLVGIPRTLPSGNPSEQPSKPSENPVHPSSFTWINPLHCTVLEHRVATL